MTQSTATTLLVIAAAAVLAPILSELIERVRIPSAPNTTALVGAGMLSVLPSRWPVSPWPARATSVDAGQATVTNDSRS